MADFPWKNNRDYFCGNRDLAGTEQGVGGLANADGIRARVAQANLTY